jgi:hypothetical protein
MFCQFTDIVDMEISVLTVAGLNITVSDTMFDVNPLRLKVI